MMLKAGLTTFAATLLALGQLGQAWCQGSAKGPIEERGDLGGAEFRISIPVNWNGGLLMYAHGYRVTQPTEGPRTRPPWEGSDRMAEAAARHGFALAESKWRKPGYAIREGVLDTEALRSYFVSKYGPTKPTIMSGTHLGASITYDAIERFPEVYDGALALAGSSVPRLKYLKSRVFDMRVLFDYYFPGLSGSAVEFPDGLQTMTRAGEKIRELIAAEPGKAEMFIRLVDLPSVDSIAPTLSFFCEYLRELDEMFGGNMFDNTNTIYFGSGDDAKLNREIPRYTADAANGIEYIRQWTTPTGAISDPVISLVPLIDRIVPPASMSAYEHQTILAGTSELFVQYWVDRNGPRFTTDEIGEVLGRLIRWIERGQRPAPGELLTGE